MNYYSKYLKYKNKYLVLRSNIEKLKGLQIGGASIEQNKDTKQSETGSFFDDLFPNSEEDNDKKESHKKEDKLDGACVESPQPFGRITDGLKRQLAQSKVPRTEVQDELERPPITRDGLQRQLAQPGAPITGVQK